MPSSPSDCAVCSCDFSAILSELFRQKCHLRHQTAVCSCDLSDILSELFRQNCHLLNKTAVCSRDFSDILLEPSRQNGHLRNLTAVCILSELCQQILLFLKVGQTKSITIFKLSNQQHNHPLFAQCQWMPRDFFFLWRQKYHGKSPQTRCEESQGGSSWSERNPSGKTRSP